MHRSKPIGIYYSVNGEPPPSRTSTPNLHLGMPLSNCRKSRQTANLERRQRKKKAYLWRNNDKNHVGLLFSHHVRKMTMERNISTMERKQNQPRCVYPVKLSFKSERETRAFPGGKSRPQSQRRAGKVLTQSSAHLAKEGPFH